MMKAAVLVAGMVLASVSVQAADFAGKKVLFIDSYHEGYPWSDGITEGVKAVIEPSKAELKIIRLDTKRNGGEDFAVKAGEQAKAVIEDYKPDVVVAADDNASRHVIAKFYKGSAIPFVFCGVNWDASGYGFPTDNVTGMLEVASVNELVDLLKQTSAGERVALLTADSETERKDAANVKKTFGMTFTEEVYVQDFAAWKAAFGDLQGKADILFVSNNAGIKDWNDAEAAAFAEANTKIPTGSVYDFMAPYVLVSYAKIAQEQGHWAAETALQILSGTSPKDIPITHNKDGQMIINARIAQKMNAELPPEIIQNADSVIE